MLENLIVDPEFEEKIPRLSDEEFQLLEQLILEEGRIKDPIVTWNGIIVDGHNRYRIMLKHPEIQIPFDIYEKKFPDRFAAIAWICRNQLGRRNLTPENRRYLIGKQYEAEKASHGGDHGKLGAERYREALEILVTAWGGDMESLRGETVQGICRFVDLYYGEFDPHRLVLRLRRVDPLTIYREGKAMGVNMPASQKYLYQVFRIYNGSSKVHSLPLKF